jgi:predicted MFS family arabinose efflux permease
VVVERHADLSVTALLHRLEAPVGGPANMRVVAVLASVLALDAADKGTIGATAPNLEHAFAIGKVEIGFLLTVSALVGALATLPFGALVDRVDRTRLLVAVIGLWAVAMVASAAVPSYRWLLVTRLLLGAVTAAAAPAVASLVGDYFPPDERARIYGMVLAGELVGTGFGVAIAGGIASVLSWRAAFVALAVPALGVGWLVHRLDEPTRRRSVPEAAAAEPVPEPGRRARAEPAGVLHDGARLSFVAAVKHVLRVRTNLIVIVSSALGYYLFAGLRAFGVEFADERYGIGQAAASALVFVLGIGAVSGVVLGGRIADRLLRRGLLDARIVVPAVGFVATAVFFAPAVLTTSIVVAGPLLTAAGFCLAVANPPLDAARLDVIPPALWGRAEAVRTAVRSGLEAVAPLLFGAVAEYVFGGRTSSGLTATFLVMLVPLVASGGVLLLARRTYLTDAASATAST